MIFLELPTLEINYLVLIWSLLMIVLLMPTFSKVNNLFTHFRSFLQYPMVSPLWKSNSGIKVNQSPRMILSAIRKGITLGILNSSVKGQGISHNGTGIDFLSKRDQKLKLNSIYVGK